MEIPERPNRLAFFRRQLGLTAHALALEVGVAPQTITRIESGYIRKPRRITKEAIAETLGVSVREVWPDGDGDD
jgi:DNA-binding XRE family transcriptional regulator